MPATQKNKNEGWKMYEVVNFEELRVHRQTKNYDLAIESNFNIAHINSKAMQRVSNFVGRPQKELIADVAKDEFTAKLLAMIVSLNASRQGTKDEGMVIEGVAGALSLSGVSIRKLSVDEKIPIRGTPQILSRKEARRDYDKIDLLKSFDFFGQIEETNQKIFGFAKICLGSGGHQDNVYHETREVVDWCREFGAKENLYVFMIDTNDKSGKFDRLETEVHKNIWMCNHRTFQQRIYNTILRKN